LLCFACLLGWILLGRMDGSYAWIGSENSVQDSHSTPQGVRKSNIFTTIQFIHICATSIHIHEKENTFTFSYSKIIFQQKILFISSFHFQVQFSEAPNQLHGKMTLEAFLGNSMLRFSSIKYSMLGWFQNHHTCSGRALLVSPPCFFTNRIGLSFSPQERACRATRCVTQISKPQGSLERAQGSRVCS